LPMTMTEGNWKEAQGVKRNWLENKTNKTAIVSSRGKKKGIAMGGLQRQNGSVGKERERGERRLLRKRPKRGNKVGARSLPDGKLIMRKKKGGCQIVVCVAST